MVLYVLPPHCYLCLPWICRCASALLTSPWVHTHRVSLCRTRHLSSSLVYPVFAIYLRPLRAVLPPSGCLHFHIRECQCSMIPSPLVLARRQLPHRLPAAADLSLSGRSCSVHARCPCAVDHAFGGSSVASRLFSLLVCARLSPRMSPCRMHHLPSGFHCPVFVVLSFCLGTCSLFLLSLLSYSTVLMLNTYIAIGPPQAAVATSASGGCRATSVGVLCSIFGELRLHC